MSPSPTLDLFVRMQTVPEQRPLGTLQPTPYGICTVVALAFDLASATLAQSCSTLHIIFFVIISLLLSLLLKLT